MFERLAAKVLDRILSGYLLRRIECNSRNNNMSNDNNDENEFENDNLLNSNNKDEKIGGMKVDGVGHIGSGDGGDGVGVYLNDI